MPLPARFLDELRARIPLSSFIGQHVALQRAGREFKACCPFHKEKSPSFYVNDVKGFYHCFGCGAHGDIIGFAMNQMRWEFPEAIENLARIAGLPVPERTQETREQKDTRTRLYALCDAAAAFFTRQLNSSAGAKALAYLKGRGLEDETIAAWRLGYAPDDAQALIRALNDAGYSLDEMMQVGLVRKSERDGGAYSFFRGRVIFPVTDMRERVVAFGARLLQGEGPKYINSPEHALFKKGELLFGAALARRTDQTLPLVLAEGYMDVIALHQAGFAAVAPLGTALTETQLQVLWRHAAARDARTPVLSFDGDGAGIRAAARALTLALPHVTPNQTLNFLFLPNGEDPDSLIKNRGADAFAQVLKQTQPLFDVLWGQAVAGKPTQSPEDKAALEKTLATLIAPVKDPTLKRHYEREVKDRLWQLFNKRGKAAANINTKAPQAARAGTMDPWHIRGQLLLATLINNPELLAGLEDWLLETKLSNDTGQELIRKTLLEALSEFGSALDAGTLGGYLEQRCGSAAVSGIFTEELYRLEPSLRQRSLERARMTLEDLKQHYDLNRMRDDMQAAGRDLADTFDETSLTRMLTLQAEFARMPDVLTDGAYNDASGEAAAEG